MIPRHTSDEVNIAVITARSTQLVAVAHGEFRGECGDQHCYGCERCESLEGVLRDLAEMQDKADMTEEARTRLRFEYTESVRNIQA